MYGLQGAGRGTRFRGGPGRCYLVGTGKDLATLLTQTSDTNRSMLSDSPRGANSLALYRLCVEME